MALNQSPVKENKKDETLRWRTNKLMRHLIYHLSVTSRFCHLKKIGCPEFEKKLFELELFLATAVSTISVNSSLNIES